MENRLFEQTLKLTAKKAGLLFFVRIFALVVAFVANLIYGRLLGADLYGVYQLAFTLVTSLAMFSVFGMNFGLVRFIPIYESGEGEKAIKSIVNFSFLLTFIFSFSMGIFLWLGRDIIALKFFKEARLSSILPIFSAVLVINSLIVLAGGVIQAKKEAPFFALLKEVLNRLFIILFFLGFYLCWENKLFSISWATFIAGIIILSLALRWIKKQFPFLFKGRILPPGKRKEFLLYSSNLLFVSFTYFLMSEVNRLLIGFYRASREVGLYAIGVVVSRLVPMILFTFNAIFAPIISELYHKNEYEALKKMYSTLTRLIWIFTLPVFLWITVFSEQILFLFGAEFTAAKWILIFLAISQFINAVAGPNGLMLSMSGHQKWEMFNGAFVASVNVMLNLLLIPRYGALGSAIAGAAALAVINVLKTLEVWFMMKMIPYNRKFLKPVIAGVAGWFVLSSLKGYLKPGIAGLGVSALVSGGVILGLIYILGLEEEDRLLLDALKRKLLGMLR